MIIFFLFDKSDVISQKNTSYRTLAADVSSNLSYYTVTYDLQGGHNSILNPVHFQDQDLPIMLHSPQKDGYYFLGWYHDEHYNQRVLQINQPCSIHLYAKWILKIDIHRNILNYNYHTNDIHLKNLMYVPFEALDTPGNPKTRIEDLSNDRFASEFQCPQGLCQTDKYIIVSSYALEENTKGALTFYDKNSGNYIMTFGMEANSHLGGIAFDGEHIWICHSNSRTIEGISYSFLERILSVSNQNFIDISHCFQHYTVDNKPSCITYHNGLYYIATHHAYAPSIMCTYKKMNHAMIKQNTYIIPPKVQGFDFLPDGRLLLSRSYGRMQSSYLTIYENMEQMLDNPLAYSNQIELPPGSEEIITKDNGCLVLFETASYKYLEGADGKGSCLYPIDKLIYVSLEHL